ncbi:MAG TPA: hypothetical protein VKK61_02910, partial [Tepidisphaeraceae bacterium]|nr:hypothetical protein [Tepidisphaeraceae bacterium]
MSHFEATGHIVMPGNQGGNIDTTANIAAPIPSLHTPRHRRALWVKWIMIGFISLSLLAVFVAGMQLRQWTWMHCESMRFEHDIRNAYYWGSRVNQDAVRPYVYNQAGTWRQFWAGYQQIYDREWTTPSFTDTALDYTPLRLLVAAIWSRWVLSKHLFTFFSSAGLWRNTYPLLWLNNICGIATSAGAFFLTRYWTLRRLPQSRLRAWIYSSIAAALVWLNPALILDSHGWPQWDVWCAPFLLWGIFYASTGAWFIAAVLFVIGAMLKGQILLVAPAIIAWAIFAGGYKPILRFALGILTSSGIIASIWLLPSAAAW